MIGKDVEKFFWVVKYKLFNVEDVKKMIGLGVKLNVWIMCWYDELWWFVFKFFFIYIFR